MTVPLIVLAALAARDLSRRAPLAEAGLALCLVASLLFGFRTYLPSLLDPGRGLRAGERIEARTERRHHRAGESVDWPGRGDGERDGHGQPSGSGRSERGRFEDSTPIRRGMSGEGGGGCGALLDRTRSEVRIAPGRVQPGARGVDGFGRVAVGASVPVGFTQRW